VLERIRARAGRLVSRVTSVSTSGNAKIHTSDAARLSGIGVGLRGRRGAAGGGCAVRRRAGAAGAAASSRGGGSDLPHEVKATRSESAHARERREEVMGFGEAVSRGDYGSADAHAVR
jgi:hypothetical protein